MSDASSNSTEEREQERLAPSGLETETDWEARTETMVPDGLSFRFVSFTKLQPHERRDKTTRRNVRSHAQRNYQAKRKLLHVRKENHSAAGLRPPATLSPASLLPSNPSPVTYLAAGLADPFSTLPINLSETDLFVLNRFHQFAFDLDTISRFAPEVPMTSAYVPVAMKDPILLNSILRVGTRCLELSNPENKGFRQLGLVYQGNLIAAINEALTDEQRASSDAVIGGLSELMGHAFLMDSNCDEYHLHARAVHHLVELRGGLDKLGMKGFLAWSIVMIDMGAASHFGTEPYYTQVPPQKPVLSIGSLNKGFLPQPILSNLSEELIGVLDEICAMLNTANSGKNTFDRDAVIVYHDRLWLVVGQCKKVDPLLELPDVNLCTCIAAQFFSTVIVADFPIHAFPALHSSRNLFNAVSRLLALKTHGLLDLLFWAAFMGSLAVDVPEHLREWLKIIASIAGNLGIGTWEEAMPILKTFLWLEPRSRELGKATWLGVEALGII